MLRASIGNLWPRNAIILLQFILDSVLKWGVTVLRGHFFFSTGNRLVVMAVVIV